MEKYYCTNGYEQFEITKQQNQTYTALQKAAEKMGLNNYQQQKSEWLKKHKSMKNFRFAVTEAHDKVVKAMPDVLSGKISCEEAMGLLWDYDVKQQRLGII